MAELPDKVVELLRNQIPYAGTDLVSNPVVVFLQNLVERIEALEAEVFEDEEVS